MNPGEIRERVDSIMMEEFELSQENLTADALLNDGLGLDSLDSVDLIVALEKEFKFRIEEAEAREIRTLGDIYERIALRLRAAERAL